MFPELVCFKADTILKSDRIAVSSLALKYLSVAYIYQSCSYSFPSLMKATKQNVSSHNKKHLKITLDSHKLNSTLELMDKLPNSVTCKFNRCKPSVQFLKKSKRLADKLMNCSITKVILIKVYTSPVSMFMEGLESVINTFNNNYHKRD